MPNFYVGRETVKRAAGLWGADKDTLLDRLIEAKSREVEQLTHRFFIPKAQTRVHPWPPLFLGQGHILWLDQDLISITTLQTKAQGASPTTIVAADYFLEPANTGPPYSRIEIDLSSTAAFEAGDTPQRSISIEGLWGYGNDTSAAGTVVSGLAADATVTTFVCSDASVIDVGDTLLIESEQLFVSGRLTADVGKNTDGALTASLAETAVTLQAAHGVVAGEVILINSEKMYVDSVATNVLTVKRGYDDTTLAAHNDAQDVYAYRTLMVVRGVNGTTAATHANATAVNKYVPPRDVSELCLAEVISSYNQGQAGWGRTVGMGEGARELSGIALSDLRKRVVETYRRMMMGAI